MMIPQEAIKAMKFYKEKLYNGIFNQFISAFDIAIEALEKQIPKKPTMVGEEYIFERDEWEKDYECSTCGNPYVGDSYCSCCGQKLDWSDTK